MKAKAILCYVWSSSVCFFVPWPWWINVILVRGILLKERLAHIQIFQCNGDSDFLWLIRSMQLIYFSHFLNSVEITMYVCYVPSTTEGLISLYNVYKARSRRSSSLNESFTFQVWAIFKDTDKSYSLWSYTEELIIFTQMQGEWNWGWVI